MTVDRRSFEVLVMAEHQAAIRRSQELAGRGEQTMDVKDRENVARGYVRAREGQCLAEVGARPTSLALGSRRSRDRVLKQDVEVEGGNGLDLREQAEIRHAAQ